MKKRRIYHKTAAVLAMSILLTGTCSFSARANALDDAKKFLLDLKDKAVKFLDDSGIAPTVKEGYDAAVDFVFTYETQPDDADMENLARSWAVTAWLADEEKEESNTYYFDNHTLTMVEDLAQIGRGYNLKKTPDGSSLNEKHSGVLKAVVKSATVYTVEWVNYNDELAQSLMQKMKEKNASETEAGQSAAAPQTEEEKTES